MPAEPPHRLQVSPPLVFLGVVGFFGPVLVFLTPPMQAPDEPGHLYRIWQICDGVLVSPQHRASVPVDLERMAKAYAHDHARPTPRAQWRRIDRDFGNALVKQRTVERNIGTISLYSPVAYAPALAGGWIARHLDCSASGFLYWSRFGSIVGYAVLGWLAIRVAPVLKWAACATLASPMAVFQAAALSADGMAIATTILASALLLRMSLDRKRQSAVRVVALVVVLGAMTLCKSAYAPVALLALCVPAGNWPGRRWICLLVIAVCVGGCFFGWSAMADPMSTHKPDGSSPAAQLQWVRQHPLWFVRAQLRSLWQDRTLYVESYVGDFGWLDVYLPLAAVLIYLVFVVGIAVGSGDAALVPGKTRQVAAVAALLCMLLISLANYVLWTSYRSATAEGAQGRYYIPTALLVLMQFHGSWSWRINERVKGMVIAGYLLGSVILIYQYFYRW